VGYSWESFAKNAYQIMVDIDAAELFKPTLRVDMPVCANLRDVIPSLLKHDYIANIRHAEWLTWSSEINKRYPASQPVSTANDSPMNPYAFIPLLWNELYDDEKVVTGNGSACVITFQTASIKEEQRLFTNSACASMGYGLPAAMGAAIGLGSRVVCIDGDGSIMMNLQELQTISHNKIDIKIFLLNNKGYHSCRQTQNNLFNANFVGMGAESGDISFPDFKKLAEAFSIPYFNITRLSETLKTLPAMLSAKGPALCEVILDEKQFFEPKISSRVLEDGTIISPEIDDMFPFLPRDEYNANKFKD
jgi:acetolactate synthase-1/2/3 large subunit